jgi:hypothetical protein
VWLVGARTTNARLIGRHVDFDLRTTSRLRQHGTRRLSEHLVQTPTDSPTQWPLPRELCEFAFPPLPAACLCAPMLTMPSSKRRKFVAGTIHPSHALRKVEQDTWVEILQETCSTRNSAPEHHRCNIALTHNTFANIVFHRRCLLC